MNRNNSDREMRMECIAVLAKLQDIIEAYNYKRNELSNKIEITSMQLADLAHYIELDFTNDDEIRSKELINTYKSILKERRSAKDELKVYEILDDMMKHGANSTIIKKAISQITKMDNRVYCPRILKELWDENEIFSFDE